VAAGTNRPISLKLRALERRGINCRHLRISGGKRIRIRLFSRHPYNDAFLIYNESMWLILALVGHSAKALGFLGDKLFIEKLLPSPRALAFLSGIGGLFFLLASPWYLRFAPLAVLASSVGAGIISIYALIYFYRAVDRDEISRVVPAIGSIMPIATFVLSYIILGERLGDRTLFAFSFLAVGGILIAFHSFSRIFKIGYFSLFFMEIWIAFLFALSAVLVKFAFERTDDFSAFLWFRIGSVGAVLPLLIYPEVRERLKFVSLKKSGAKNEIFYLLSRVFAGISPLIIWFAISYGSVTLVNSLQGIQYPLLFVLALFFSSRWPNIFQEEISRGSILQKSLATVFIFVGLALLI
jgi:uncharacterized membrane protein